MTHKTIDISEPFTPYNGRNIRVTFTYKNLQTRLSFFCAIQRRSLPHGFITLTLTLTHTHTHSSSSLTPQITLAHYRSLKTHIKLMEVWRFKTHYIKTVYTCSLITVKWQKLVGYGQADRIGHSRGTKVRTDRTCTDRSPTRCTAYPPNRSQHMCNKTLLPTTQQALRISRTSTGWKIIQIKHGNFNLMHPFR